MAIDYTAEKTRGTEWVTHNAILPVAEIRNSSNSPIAFTLLTDRLVLSVMKMNIY